MKNKLCKGCNEVKPLEGFHKNPRHPGGYHRYCKICRKTETSKRYIAHRETMNEKSRSYQLAHPIRRRVIVEKWRCKNEGVEGVVTYEDWKAVLTKQNFACANCSRRTMLEMDHIHPILFGGLHVPSNIQGLCRPCNVRKGNVQRTPC